MTLHTGFITPSSCYPGILHLCPWQKEGQQALKLLINQEAIPILFFDWASKLAFQRALPVKPSQRKRYRKVLEKANELNLAIGPEALSFDRCRAASGKATASDDDRIGALLVRLGLIESAELQAALGDQAQSSNAHIAIGKLLVRHGLCAPAEMLMALQRQREYRRQGVQLGLILVKNGQLSDARLTDALIRQQDQYRPLGEILVELGYCSQEAVNVALGEQQVLRYTELLREFQLDLKPTRSSANP